MHVELMKTESIRLSKEISILKDKISEFPKGKLIVTRNGNYDKWYLFDGKGEKYLPKAEKELAKKLALKRFYSEKLLMLETEKEATEAYLRYEKELCHNRMLLFFNNPGYERLFENELNKSGYAYTWAQASYERYNGYPEKLICKTRAGIMVRSKSEAAIVDALYDLGIPFRYEDTLHLVGGDVHPDISTMNPDTCKVLYWEHFGRMDDPMYSHDQFGKMELYNNNGIVPGIDLIMTFETKEHPFTSEDVMKVIKQYYPEFL